MAAKHLNKIFLSASIPSIERHPKFYESVDVIAIRDSIRALAAVVIPNAHLVWGGHPSITPLIRYVMEKMSSNLKQHVTIYQSLFFEDRFPTDNFDFEHIELTKMVPNNETESLKIMRDKMITENVFSAAVFIGGMEGILSEFEQFKSIHPNALLLPVASTGAAAKVVYQNNIEAFDKRLADDYAYMALFKDLLADFLS